MAIYKILSEYHWFQFVFYALWLLAAGAVTYGVFLRPRVMSKREGSDTAIERSKTNIPINTASPVPPNDVARPAPDPLPVKTHERTENVVWWVGRPYPNNNILADVTEPALDLDQLVEFCSKPQQRGEPVKESAFPRRLEHSVKFKKSAQETNSGRRLPYFSNHDFFCVAHEAIDVFERHDLGDAQFRDVEFFEFKGEKRVEERLRILVPCNPKQGLIAAESPKVVKAFAGIPELAGKGVASSRLKDGDVAVAKSVLDGPDIWIDPAFRLTFFMSDRLAQALYDADLAQDFQLRWARVL